MFFTSPHFTDGWVTPLRMTGSEGVITRGDSLPLYTQTGNVKQILGWRLIFVVIWTDFVYK